ncbi:galactosylceramide sulfotransferase-like [Branchiostoma lanceolatum]|uniref:galactosylceramide sulfotransferase-like n=1 Tax=Branchiostoma lanceolatum TaxID=7740 RepID=UPI0034562593
MQGGRLLTVFLLLVVLMGTAFYHIQHNSPMEINTDAVRPRPEQHDGFKDLQSQTSVLSNAETVAFRNKTQWDVTVHSDTEDMTNGTCRPHLNVAFMKVHKCGSSLMFHMLLRFGYEHNVIVALPRQKNREIIGGFGTIKDDDFLAPPGGKRWNIFGHHAFYNRTRFPQLMAPNTRYVAILREPLRRLKSAFQYFNLGKGFPGLEKQTPKGIAPVTTYLAKPMYWDPLFKFKPFFSVKKRTSEFLVKAKEHFCFRNCMSRDLGFSEKDYDNNTAVEEFVRGIENDFTTVLIIEYLPASLILLKRRMCWTFYDILYGHHPRRQRYKLKTPITDDMKSTFYQHNYADLMLYTRFNESFQRQISQEGADFQDEVSHFMRINKDVGSFCRSKKRQGKGKMIVKKSKWNDAFSLGKSLCSRYVRNRQYWDALLRSRYQHTQNKELENENSVVQITKSRPRKPPKRPSRKPQKRPLRKPRKRPPRKPRKRPPRKPRKRPQKSRKRKH